MAADDATSREPFFVTTRPHFLVIGAMKCATTTLHQQLSAQPGIFLTDKLDEPDFFSDDERYAQGMDWYAGLFDGAADGDICGDISTGYAKLPTDPHAVQRIEQHLPDARFVYLMRHPVDRLVSHYIHDWSVGRIEMPIDEAVNAHPVLVDYGRYAMQLEPYLETFGPDRVLPVFFERFISESQAELERVCRFIGYSSQPEWTTEQEHANSSSARLRRSPARDLIINLPLVRTIRRRLVPQGFRDRIKRLWSMDERPKLSPGAMASVVETFDQDLSKLGSWLGVGLSCENFKERVAGLTPVWTDRAPRSVATDA